MKCAHIINKISVSCFYRIVGPMLINKVGVPIKDCIQDFSKVEVVNDHTEGKD